MTLQNKVAIVTGASRGIGEAVAKAFAREGVDLALIARNESELQQVSADIREKGRDCLVIPTDVRNEDEICGAVRRTLDHYGKIDILVNNAGIGLFKPVQDTALDEWNCVLATNLTAPFLFSREVLPTMVERGQGQIINISSDVGKRTIPKGAAYCASKFGIHAFSGALAKEVRKLGIKVGVISPGMTDTYFNESEQGDPEKKGWLLAEDIAEAVVFMASRPRHALIDELEIHPIIQEY
ncbi:SDR family oxidoreductase [Numidum massiliense]|uniref:SDR family oxidoreductase n=1 Tax=Numidum massiliense TaxID=1522315 RepID=UPI0006D57956|nr:SDR family NAD(P)-dependent oxidoreductase [Numidum massiliense]